ncbi:hypothetical protein niasHT_018832 [Heterodera trifolii]|uniref:Piwi domain-containing protein n=1 Tax=Heterodera trifolii TaxID=157864 RepID=A0ABD2L399_9BILA
MIILAKCITKNLNLTREKKPVTRVTFYTGTGTGYGLGTDTAQKNTGYGLRARENPCTGPARVRSLLNIQKASQKLAINSDGTRSIVEPMADVFGPVVQGATFVEPRKAPGTAGQKGRMKLITNAHILKLLGTQAIYHYEVTINAVCSPYNRVLCVSQPNGRRDRDDFPLLNRRDKCREVFLAFYRTMEQSLKDTGNVLYYDLSKSMFTLKNLQIESEGKFTFKIDAVPTAERPDAARYKHYEFIIKPAPYFVVDDLSFITNDVSKMERSLEQFLDIATAQKANMDGKQVIGFSSSRVYLLAPTDYGFEVNECPVFDSNHSFIGVGMKKGCRIVEGNQGPDQMTPAIVIQTKKSAFHIPDMCILDKAKTLLFRENQGRFETGDFTQSDYEALCNGLVGIYAEPRYGTSGRFFRISDITKPNTGNGFNAENTFITHQVSGKISVKQYFEDTYRKTLQIGDPAYYPMEVCFVLDGQRVKSFQQNPEQIREMIKETAIPPTVLRVHNERVKESLQLVNNEYLTKASVHFDTTPLHVDYRVLGPPATLYRNKHRVTLAASNCEWRPGDALVNAQIGTWVAYAFGNSAGDSMRRLGLTETMWRNFVDKYASEMRNKGIVCAPPVRVSIYWFTSVNEVLNVLLKEAGPLKGGVQFCLIGHAKGSEGDDVHATIKAFEQLTDIVTQAITFDVLKDVLDKGSPLTVANCIHKTNVKMGGLNYALHVDDPSVAQLFDDQTLFLGFAMNFPGGFAPSESAAPINGANGAVPSGSKAGPGAPVPRFRFSLPPPSCIGWAATIGKKKDEYIGDFFYQAPRREEKMDVIVSVVRRCIESFKTNRKDKFPQRVVIFRNGCTEGQFAYVMSYEIPKVKETLKTLGCTAKLTVIVPNRLQDVRFLRQDARPEDKSNEQNIPPGTVVDTVVVHPKRYEFFLNSHVAIKGTARTPHYTVLLDDNNMSVDTLQTMVHYLCFEHQIVTKPTSLPSPVYIANEYAKRGRNIYSYYAKNGIDNLQDSARNKGLGWPLLTYEDITKVLSFEKTNFLKDLRINA